MKVIILAGGLGTRISEETADKPKPMVEIASRPILWHLMNIYAQQGVRDFVIATGIQHSVREFIEIAASELALTINWKGKGELEQGIDQNGRVIIRIDKRYFRPSEVPQLLGDASKAKELLNWEPKISFSELVSEMIRSDSEIAQNEKSKITL